MKQTINLIIGCVFFVLLLTFCTSAEDKKHQSFVKSILSEDINNFLNIEYMHRNRLENFNYFLADSLFTTWVYNPATSQIDSFDSIKMSRFTKNPTEYTRTISQKIKKLGIEMISQSAWHGKVINLWIKDNEFYTYVSPEFELNNKSASLLREELRNSIKINRNWYYKKLKVCRNK